MLLTRIQQNLTEKEAALALYIRAHGMDGTAVYWALVADAEKARRWAARSN